MEKGKLRIFLGYAAGVGKTYAMLQSAHELHKARVDVVVGYVEPHQRPDTSAQLEGLEAIPHKIIDYKGIQLREFDLEAALRRHPEVVLVDELAHTNVMGSQNAKRYQDVEELLKHGIDVYTTVNIQHIESLNDIVESITGVVVNERIPDNVFDLAETVELIDIDPHELIHRLERGKIYQDVQAKRALENFFTEDKLVALREIALRKVADKINHAYDKEFGHFRDGNIAVQEHILVCLSPAPSNMKVIRSAARMVHAFHAKFTAIYVMDDETESTEFEPSLLANMKLAEDFGASITTLQGNDVAMQIAEYAQVSRVTKIVIGRSIQPHVFRFRPNIIDQIGTYAPTIDVYVIPDIPNAHLKRKRTTLDEGFRWLDGFQVLAALGITTLINYFLDQLGVQEVNLIMVYILGVLIVSITTSSHIWSSMTSLGTVLLFNYFFTNPRFTLNATEKGYPLTFLIMFIVSFTVSALAFRIQMNDRKNARKTYRTEVLLDTSLKLQNLRNPEEVVHEIGNQLKRLTNRSVIIYIEIDDKLVPTVFSDESYERIHDIYLSSQEQTIAQWVFQNNRRAGAGTRTLSNAQCVYYAVRSNEAVSAVVGFDENLDWDPFEKSLAVSIINEFGLTLEAIALSKHQKNQDEAIRQERLRTDILRSISHDLRTPLTTIIGNADQLLTQDIDMEDRDKHYRNIKEESDWLLKRVENILAMTRLDSATVLNETVEVFEDLIDEALRRLEYLSQGKRIQFERPEDVYLVSVDAKLMIQVIVNVCDNALKYSGPDSDVILRLYGDETTVFLDIEDNGVGIPTDQHSKIFKMFYSNANPKDQGRGIGLGLYLCQSIMNAHGGNISVRDNIPHGSIFTLTLERKHVSNDPL